MFAHHNNNRDPRKRPKSLVEPERARFESYHSPAQQQLDKKTIAAFGAGRLLVLDSGSNELVHPDRVFIPSLTRFVEYIDTETELRISEIREGWLEREERVDQAVSDSRAEPDVTVAA